MESFWFNFWNKMKQLFPWTHSNQKFSSIWTFLIQNCTIIFLIKYYRLQLTSFRSMLINQTFHTIMKHTMSISIFQLKPSIMSINKKITGVTQTFYPLNIRFWKKHTCIFTALNTLDINTKINHLTFSYYILNHIINTIFITLFLAKYEGDG